MLRTFQMTLVDTFLSTFKLIFILKQLALILRRTRVLVALLLLFFGCLVTVNVPWLFLTVSCVALQCVIVVFPVHNRLLFVDLLFIVAHGV